MPNDLLIIAPDADPPIEHEPEASYARSLFEILRRRSGPLLEEKGFFTSDFGKETPRTGFKAWIVGKHDGGEFAMFLRAHGGKLIFW